MSEYKQDLELDTIMVHAAMNGLFDLLAIQKFKTPQEAYERALWLKKQPEFYITAVNNRVAEIEKEGNTYAG
jgi:hypothetical protein